MELERAIAVDKFRTRCGAERMRASIACSIGDNGIAIARENGRHVPLRLDIVTPDERRRLLVLDSSGTPQQPRCAVVSEVGLPVAPNTWEAVFARASRRCQAAGLDYDVSPHQLRHSFAVHMLALLIRQRSGEVSKEQDLSGATYRHLVGDPLQQAQRLLGHASLATTYIYLDHLAGCQDTVDTAVEELLAGIDPPQALQAAA
jgi:integrase